MATTDADFARFTEIDLDETTSRLTQLAVCYQAWLTGLDTSLLDTQPTDQTWTLREVVHHGAEVTYYARTVGRLAVAASTRRRPAADQTSG